MRDIGHVRFAPATDDERERGLLGYVELEYGHALVLDGVAVRRTQNGRIALVFPSRRDRQGRRHPFMRLRGEGARQQLERQVVRALSDRGVL